MKPVFNHPWDVSVKRARTIQDELRGRASRRERPRNVTLIAGVDVGFAEGNRVAVASVVVLNYPTLEPVESATARKPVSFPYVPGLLSFREIPVILMALEKLKVTPDLLLCDGQGVAHPKRLGLATHLGILLNVPTIGVAKSRLIGVHGPVPERKGEWTPLRDEGETIGAVLRTRENVKPLFVSIGHKINLRAAVRHVMGCVTKYRLPETTRAAHNLASGNKRKSSTILNS